MALIDNAEHLRAALDYHLDRHNLLASNLAHIDTPGYKPVDLERTGVGFSTEMHVAMTATDSAHMSGSNGGTAGSEATGGISHGRVVEDPGSAAGGDNNGVDLDREAVKIASNQMRYDMISQLASSELEGLEWAAKDGK
jgi:flagellar basal-body rod protein FlgB